MRKSIQKIQNFKKEGKKITVLTAYDFSTAKYLDQAGVDIILVGDSLAQVALGYENTTDIGMDEMLVFTSPDISADEEYTIFLSTSTTIAVILWDMFMECSTSERPVGLLSKAVSILSE